MSAGTAQVKAWEGRIVAVNSDTFTAEVTPITPGGRPFLADFYTWALTDGGDPEVGQLVDVMVRVAGDARTCSVVLRDMGSWTAEEVVAVQERAAAAHAALRGRADT